MAKKAEAEAIVLEVDETGLAKTLENNEVIENVRKCASKEEAAPAIKEVEQLGKLMRAVNEYGKHAQEYIELEARTYIEIARLWGDPKSMKCTKKQREIIEWLCNMSRYEQDDVLQDCLAEGTRIGAQHNAWWNDRTYKKQEEQVEKVSRELLGEYLDTGKVEIGASKMPSASKFVADAASDRTKDKLLKAGAVGVGNNVYINPAENASAKYATKAIANRAESITADVKALDQLIDTFPREFQDAATEMLEDEYPWIEAKRLTFYHNQRVNNRIESVFDEIAHGKGIFRYWASQDEIYESQYLSDYESPTPGGEYHSAEAFRELHEKTVAFCGDCVFTAGDQDNIEVEPSARIRFARPDEGTDILNECYVQGLTGEMICREANKAYKRIAFKRSSDAREQADDIVSNLLKTLLLRFPDSKECWFVLLHIIESLLWQTIYCHVDTEEESK